VDILKIRPYQLMCLICSFGENSSGPQDERSKQILEKIREFPSRPIMLVCNAGDMFSYQDPGDKDDTVKGSDFDRLRDLEILHKLDLMPGAILPARLLLFRIFEQIRTSEEICGYEDATSGKWVGCKKAENKSYEKALQEVVAGNPDCYRDFYKLLGQGKRSIIIERKEEELDREKVKSLDKMFKAKEISVRPHILLCAVEQFAEGLNPPFENDNLPEMIQHIIKNPEQKIKLVQGADWMICAPCPVRDIDLNACCLAVKGGGGLSNQLRDLRLLKTLGLKFGDSMKAKDLYKLIFEKVKTTNEICTFEGIYPSVWQERCAADNLKWTKEAKENELYKKGRKMLMEALGIKTKVVKTTLKE
jgi:hypothetical protein